MRLLPFSFSLTVLLVQAAKRSIFRNAVQLSLGFASLVDIDPDLHEADVLRDMARRELWPAPAAAPGAATAGRADVALPAPTTLQALAAATAQAAGPCELTATGTYLITALDLDGADLARLLSYTWCACARNREVGGRLGGRC